MANSPAANIFHLWRFQINQWWLSLTEGQRTVTGETRAVLQHFLPVLVLSTKQGVAASLSPLILGSSAPAALAGIVAANVLVFLCWRVPALQRSMVQYFTSNPASSKPPSPQQPPLCFVSLLLLLLLQGHCALP